MNIDRTTHITRVELDVQETLELIEKLTASVRHAMKYKHCVICMGAVYQDVMDKPCPGSIVFNVTED